MESSANDMNKNDLRAVFFDHAEDLFVLFDKELNILDANDTTLRTWRTTRDQFIGKNLAEISPDVKESGRYDLYKEVIRTGNPLVLDEVVHHPSLGHLVNRIKVFKVGEGLGGVLTNITDLVDTIEELDTFCYKVTHDIRRPIATILGLINVAENEVKDHNASLYLDLVKQQIELLDYILVKLFETTRIRQGEKKIYLIDFGYIICAALNSLQLMPGYQDVYIEQQIKVTKKFYSDKFIMISILQNLIENSIKYRKEDPEEQSYIKIEIEDADNGIKMIISDNGIGIPQEYQKDVFRMFFRATNKSSGSGLGLYTVSQGVKKLNGKILLSSKVNEGTIFTIYIPNENCEKVSTETDEYNASILGRSNPL